ncbi:MAG: cytidine deaminase [Oscillospiraceae bacterium]|nr:cytidine deaminase [Oscillospiraceae bacterium]
MEDDYPLLITKAREARERSWSPYSGFSVGAALLGKSGRIYQGCNVECASYSPTNCAERTAFFKAVSEGELEFDAIAIVGGPKDAADFGFAYPCGVCRQVMMEFCDPLHFKVIVANSSGEFEVHTLLQILPFGFGPSNLTRN